MLTPSTLAALALAFICGVATSLAVRRKREPLDLRAEAQARYLRSHAVRLACAQHWARGGALSKRDEPWRPVCTGLAVAALMVDDDSDVLALLSKLVGDAGTDPELANIWRQARAELVAARDRLETEFLAGVRGDGAPAWNQTELRARAAELLESAQQGALSLLAARRVPSMPPPGV